MFYFNKNIQNIFIINGYSNRSKVKDFVNFLSTIPEEEKLKNMALYTVGRNDAKRLAKEYSNIYKNAIIYSVGGDGTLNEVINGINPNCKLAIIPLGTGNDFYRVYKEIEGTQKIDLGIVNNKKFINIASIGVDAEVANKANYYKCKGKFKNFEYYAGIIDSLIKNPNYNTSLGNITLLAVCNGKYYGNNVPINPNYNLSDGEFEVYKASKLKRLEFLKLFLKIYQGNHFDNDLVDYFKTDNLQVISDKSIVCNVDGEIIYSNEFNFNVIKDGITLTNDTPEYIKKYVLNINNK